MANSISDSPHAHMTSATILKLCSSRGMYSVGTPTHHTAASDNSYFDRSCGNVLRYGVAFLYMVFIIPFWVVIAFLAASTRDLKSFAGDASVCTNPNTLRAVLRGSSTLHMLCCC